MIFCGFFISHSVWSIFDGSVLVPFGVTGRNYKDAKLVRFVNEKHYEESVEDANKFLRENSEVNKFTSIYFDGYYTYANGERIDSIFMTGHFFIENKVIEIKMCVPYQRRKFLKKFKIFKPKLIEVSNCTDSEVSNSFDYFWKGVNLHSEGSKIWNKYIDQSK